MNITVTLIAQMAAFVLLIWFVNRVLWGPLSGLLADRQKKIADGLAAADKGKHDLELSEKKAKEVLHEAKGKAAEIIAQSEKRASEIVDEAKVSAKSEGDRLLTAARAEMEQDFNRAKEDLRARVAEVALVGAERILNKEVDRQAHDQILKDLAAQI